MANIEVIEELYYEVTLHVDLRPHPDNIWPHHNTGILIDNKFNNRN